MRDMIPYEKFVELFTHFPAYSSNETKYHSYCMGRYVNDDNIPGDIVECGVAAGGNFAMMMMGHQDNNHIEMKRRFWGFDSFQGIQLAGEKDDQQPGIGKITHDVHVPEEHLLVSSGVTSYSKNVVIQNLIRWNMWNTNDIELIEGWIQHTLTDECIKKIPSISILRLDMDIYSPTKFALQKLYPLVSVGGIIIIDDWSLTGAHTACLEYFDENNLNPTILKIANSEPVYFIKENL